MPEEIFIPESVKIIRGITNHWGRFDNEGRLFPSDNKKQKMTEIPRKKVEELLKQAGFSEKEIERIKLLSYSPVPVLEINSHTTQEVAKMWGDIFGGKGTSIKEVKTAYYQCLLLGRAIGVKIITTEPDLNNPGEWKKESKVEVMVYRRVFGEEWRKINVIVIHQKDRLPPKTLEAEVDAIIVVTKTAKFIKLLVDELKYDCRIQFPGA